MYNLGFVTSTEEEFKEQLKKDDPVLYAKYKDKAILGGYKRDGEYVCIKTAEGDAEKFLNIRIRSWIKSLIP